LQPERHVPTYDYQCQDCGKPFEIRASISAYSEGLSPLCPDCGSDNAERTFGAVNVLTGSRSTGAPPAGCGTSGFG